MTVPALNARARGWLRFLWRKATTPDDEPRSVSMVAGAMELGEPGCPCCR
ncbi:MAG: hypothetical protein R2909_08080 [Gemmatimonadales bacterium]